MKTPRTGRVIGTIGSLLALVAAGAFFALRTDRFLSPDNLSLVLQQVMVVGVIAIGQTLVILTAGIDLSCGMVMALAGMVMTKLAVEHGVPVPLAIGAGVGVGMLFGLVNGLLVARLALPPFIVTLGTLNIAFAITQLYSDAQTVSDLPASMTAPSPYVFSSTFLIFSCQPAAWRHSLTDWMYLNRKSGNRILSGSLYDSSGSAHSDWSIFFAVSGPR